MLCASTLFQDGDTTCPSTGIFFFFFFETEKWKEKEHNSPLDHFSRSIQGRLTKDIKAKKRKKARAQGFGHDREKLAQRRPSSRFRVLGGGRSLVDNR